MVDRKSLTSLQRRLERRYPGIDITAILNVGDVASVQALSFVGPRDDLERYGLVPFGFDSSERVDEFGTRVVAWLVNDVNAVAIHNHDAETGARHGRLASQHPNNTRTRAIVARALGQFMQAGRRRKALGP